MKTKSAESTPATRRDIPEHLKVILEILRAADRLKTHMAQLLAPHGLTTTQYNALRILRGAPEGLAAKELRERLIERFPGITRIVDGLVDKGLVRRDPHPRDRRSILCKITDAGQELLKDLDNPVDESDRQLVRALTPAEGKQLAEWLSLVGKKHESEDKDSED